DARNSRIQHVGEGRSAKDTVDKQLQHGERIVAGEGIAATVVLRGIVNSIAGSDDGFRGELVGKTDARREVIAVAGNQSAGVSSSASNLKAEGGNVEVRNTVIHFAVGFLKLIAQSVAQSQTLCHLPGILTVELRLPTGGGRVGQLKAHRHASG